MAVAEGEEEAAGSGGGRFWMRGGVEVGRWKKLWRTPRGARALVLVTGVVVGMLAGAGSYLGGRSVGWACGGGAGL